MRTAMRRIVKNPVREITPPNAQKRTPSEMHV
jgi:hypothetical protein